jgi:hypothetical protein
VKLKESGQTWKVNIFVHVTINPRKQEKTKKLFKILMKVGMKRDIPT